MQCYGCVHFFNSTHDSMAGPGEPAECGKAGSLLNEEMDAGAGEIISTMFSGILFKLSELNNCPFYSDKAQRRSILDLKK